MFLSPTLEFILDTLMDAQCAVLNARMEGQIALKGQHDVVSSLDEASRIAVSKRLDRWMHTHGKSPIIAEEGGDFSGRLMPPEAWIVDEWDGSVASSHGFDYGAISIARREQGRVTHAGICQPFLHTLVLAELDWGCYMRQHANASFQRVRLDYSLPLAESMVAQEVGHTLNEDLCRNVLMPLSQRCQLMVRPCSSVACAVLLLQQKVAALVNVAAAKIWDLAAAELAVCEAGGCVRHLTQAGHDSCIPADYILAANQRLADEVYEVVQYWKGTGRE